MTENRRIVLKSRPVGLPTPENFALENAPVPVPGQGEMLVRTLWMSVDPYIRGRISDRKSYAPPFGIGEPLDGYFVGRVEESKGGRFPAGTHVFGTGGGWRDYHAADGKALRAVDPDIAPLQANIGVLGMPGQTAYVGLLDIGRPKEGETVFVSAASGAVGAVVCQIAKLKGCRVVGSAGSDEKCAWLLDEAGVDAAINYRTCGDLEAALAAACPDGIDVYFENVGGEHLQAALSQMNFFGRIVACGMIAGYNDSAPRPGPNNLFLVVGRRIRMQGFIVSDHRERTEDFLGDVGGWIRDGKLRWRETVVEGLERAPGRLHRPLHDPSGGSGTMLAVRLPADVEARLDSLAKATGRTKSFYARQAILQHLDDLEDLYIAERRLRDYRDGKEDTVPLEEVMRRAGTGAASGSLHGLPRTPLRLVGSPPRRACCEDRLYPGA